MGRVMQVIPAGNWTANFIDEQTHLKGDTRPLVCWALMDDGTVTGMVADGKDVKSVQECLEDFSSYHCHETRTGI